MAGETGFRRHPLAELEEKAPGLQDYGIAARCQRTEDRGRITEDTYDRKNYHGKTRKITEGEICKILILESLIIQCNSVKIRGE